MAIMAPSSRISPPGSTTYDSGTMHVGDGTWDAQRDTFLLPNLVGLNFDTMRYNGMGNRFRELTQYHILIRGHGVIAAVTFLFIVPLAIMLARFYRSRPYWAIRLHIWLQILTLLLTTVLFVLGWFAVGPSRSLSNPHHGIGLAIYVLIWVQAIGGRWVYGKEKKGKFKKRVPIKLMLHQWFGRMIALLGLAQIPLGLTLYGSPLWLFILYALAVFVLLIIYFVLSNREANSIDYGTRSSLGTTSYVREDGGRHGIRNVVGGAAAGVGLAALANRFRKRSRSRSRSRTEVIESGRGSRVDMHGSRPQSASFIEEEKYAERDRKHTWKDRLLKIGAIGGAAALAKNLVDRRRDRDEVHHDGSESYSEDSVSRVEEGRVGAGAVGGRPRPPYPSLRRRSGSYSSVSSRTSIHGGRPGRRHSLRDGVATVGALGLLRAAFKGRRDRKEQRRVEEMRQREIEEERIARQGSQGQRYTGDGFPKRGGRRGSLTASSAGYLSSSRPTTAPRIDGGRPPAIPAPYAEGDPSTRPILPPPGVGPGMVTEQQDLSGSDAYLSAGGTQHRRHRLGRDAALGTAVAAAAGEQSAGSVTPVSVKVKMHNDGRHVTLRRLTEEERTAEYARKGRNRLGKRRPGEGDGSVSSMSETGWRRTEARERIEADQMRVENEIAAQRQAGAGYPGVPLPGPPSYPPPVPGSPSYAAPVSGPAAGPYTPKPPPPMQSTLSQSGAPGSIGSPGTYTTEGEGSADRESRRRRRRAERAAGGRIPSGTVDFT